MVDVRPLWALLGAGLLSAGLAACASGSKAGGAVTITLYNGQHAQTTTQLVKAFEAQTGIRVKERDGDEDQLAQEIEQEGSASPADVIYTENSPALMDLQNRGLLAPADPSALAAVPSRFSSPTGSWVGVSARVSVMVYNTSKVSPAQLPKSVYDLAGPEWKGKLAIAPGETDFQPIVTAIAKDRGKPAALAWLRAVKANAGGHVEADNETLTSDVNSGQATIGLINSYYWWRLQNETGAAGMHSQIAYLADRDPGYVIDVSGAGVLKSSRHQAAAQELLAFLVSAAGQQGIVASDSFEYPLRPGVPGPPGLTPFADLQPYPATIADLGDGSLAIQLMQQVQLI